MKITFADKWFCIFLQFLSTVFVFFNFYQQIFSSIFINSFFPQKALEIALAAEPLTLLPFILIPIIMNIDIDIDIDVRGRVHWILLLPGLCQGVLGPLFPAEVGWGRCNMMFNKLFFQRKFNAGYCKNHFFSSNFDDCTCQEWGWCQRWGQVPKGWGRPENYEKNYEKSQTQTQ